MMYSAQHTGPHNSFISKTATQAAASAAEMDKTAFYAGVELDNASGDGSSH